ncbi:MAG: hypothetical protein ACLPYS_18710 [Vulcanimicrobiaceae bacterium]
MRCIRQAAIRCSGPWVAGDAAAARALLAAGIARLMGRAELKLFVPSNDEAALALAREAGFAAQRTLRHRIRGAPSVPRAMLFGRINLGQG